MRQGELIKKCRKAKKMTQEELALLVFGVPQSEDGYRQAISNIERGMVRVPPKHAMAFCKHLDITLDILTDAVTDDYLDAWHASVHASSV